MWSQEEASQKLHFLQEQPRCDFSRVLEQCQKFEKEEWCSNQGFSFGQARVSDLQEQKRDADKLLKSKRKQLMTAYKDVQ